MKVFIAFGETKETFETNINGLGQLKDYLTSQRKDLLEILDNNKLVYALADTSGKKKPVAISSRIAGTDFKGYDLLVISEKVQGQAFVSATAAGLVLGAASAAAAAGAATSTIILATVINAVIYAALAYALGQLIQLLTPHTKVSQASDPAQVQRNLIFNGIQNVKEQGGSVPMVFGTCLCGGVVISTKITTTSLYADTISVNTMAEAMDYPAQWLRHNP